MHKTYHAISKHGREREEKRREREGTSYNTCGALTAELNELSIPSVNEAVLPVPDCACAIKFAFLNDG
jgi:hypothetical protein